MIKNVLFQLADMTLESKIKVNVLTSNAFASFHFVILCVHVLAH